MKNFLQNLFNKKEKYILVLSGGGTRGFYTLWVLKAIEEAGWKDKIEAIYGISVWAIIAAYRASGRTAQEMFDKYKELNVSTTKWINIPPTENLLKTTTLEEEFEKDLPKTFDKLEKTVYIGATDMYTAKLILFNEGKLVPAVLGSMAIPGVFPSVKYQKYLLNDGGIIDNFPTTTAKRQYPNHKIIGIALNMFEKNKKPKNLIETLLTSFEIMLRKDLVKRSAEIDISFYENIDCQILDLNKKKREKAFTQGYESGKKIFKKEA